MELKWGIFAGCINEEKLIEAKIEWALRHDMVVSIVEGAHENYRGPLDPNGLSVDKTTEILLSYDDQINYLPLGRVKEQRLLRDRAYKELPQDLDVVIMSDIDEFLEDEDLEFLDMIYRQQKDLKLTLTNSYIFLDNKYCAPHIRRQASPPIRFNRNLNICLGQWHERIFRYNKYYGYDLSPFIINDFYGRFIISDSAYFDERTLLPEMYILHYKNFKLEEQKARHEMYKERGDKEDYDKEWEILEEKKIEFKGDHPKEIKELMNDEGSV